MRRLRVRHRPHRLSAGARHLGRRRGRGAAHHLGGRHLALLAYPDRRRIYHSLLRPPPMSASIITVDDLTMGWGEVNLLENTSFSVERGEVFAILGGSGCGKST